MKQNNIEAINEDINQDSNDKNPLGTEKIGILLRRFAIPSIIAMVVNSIYNIVDQIFIQRSADGSLGNQATTVAFPLITLTLAIALLIGNGGTAMASIKLGEKKDDEAEKILGNSFTAVVIISLIFCLACAFAFEPVLKILGATSTVMPFAKRYISIILIGTVFMGIGSGLSGFVRADGAPMVSMISLIVGCLLNVILDPIFIFGCNMGVTGAALGTIISQIVTAVIVMWYLIFKGKSMRIKAKNLIIDFGLTFRFCALGLSSFVTQFANALVQICMNQSLVYYGNKTAVGGDTAMTAMGIILKTNMLIIGVCVGIGTGAQPILGYNKGAEHYHRVKETYIKSVKAASIVSIVGWAIILFFPSAIMSIYGNNDPAMTDFACYAIRIFLGGVLCAGFNIVSSNYFQAIGKAGAAFVMSMSRQIIALIPLMLILPLFIGLDGILFAGLFADGVALIIGIIFVTRDMKELNKRLKIENTVIE